MRPPFLNGLVSRLRLGLADAKLSNASELYERLLKEGAREEAGAPARPEQEDEFGDMLAELDAVPATADFAATLALKDATIAALRRSLEELRPMGEEHAAATIWRSSGEATLATLEKLCAELGARLGVSREEDGLERQRIAELELELQQQAAAACKLEARLESVRTKYEERRKVAADRWREIRSLRGERRRLERELQQERRHREELYAPLREIADGEADSIPRESLASLFRLVAPESSCAAAPNGEPSATLES